MYQFFPEGIAGLSADAANWITTGILALIALLIVFFIYRLVRRPRFAGGRRSKHARLAITDAAAVDDRRKLVLVRRDDVEHLVLIGGATDIILESDIRKTAPARPIATATAAKPAAVPATPPQPAATRTPTPPARPAPVVGVRPAAAIAAATAGAGALAGSVSTAAASAADSVKSTVDSATDTVATAAAPAVKAVRSDSRRNDEMDALLNEVSGDK